MKRESNGNSERGSAEILHGGQPARQKTATHSSGSIPQSVASAVVIKSGDVFFLCEPDGSVALGGNHGVGLYYHDCRYLNGYEIELGDVKPQQLVASAEDGYAATFESTNAEFQGSNGKPVCKQNLGLHWHRVLDQDQLALVDRLTFRNYGVDPIEFPVIVRFSSNFENIFVIRGMNNERIGKCREPEWKADALHFSYEGVDKVYRTLTVCFSRKPDSTEATSARFPIHLPAGGSTALQVTLAIGESKQAGQAARPDFRAPNFDDLNARCGKARSKWASEHAHIRSDSRFLDRPIDRCLSDLHVLRSHLGEDAYFAAGLPWYGCLFGRDSCIASVESLAFAPQVAEETLRLLARYQGQKKDDWRDEEPGKILHELRVGELANSNQIPQTPYYGSVDSTILFLIAIGMHAQWTGDLSLFKDLRPNVDRALEWMTKYGDHDGDGYIDYEEKSEKGLSNQGWKDSSDSVMNSDGSLATPPIALAEVQGYAYLAKQLLAGLFDRVGERQTAAKLRAEAEDLKLRFNRDYWLEEKQIYAEALQRNKRPCDVMTSNPGQALWCGIIDHERAGQLTSRLLAPDMFSGWGIRTLSSKEKRYNPIGYHLGTVWPHDNAIIAAGMRKYGQDDQFMKVFEGIWDAASYFPHHRLPEVFAGFDRKSYQVPVHYPVACHPQAWAAGSLPLMLTCALGLEPSALDRRLVIRRPLLPSRVDRIELNGLSVGQAKADLRFERTADQVRATVIKVHGHLDVRIEDEPHHEAA